VFICLEGAIVDTTVRIGVREGNLCIGYKASLPKHWCMTMRACRALAQEDGTSASQFPYFERDGDYTSIF
jgi:hypothetical protein